MPVSRRRARLHSRPSIRTTFLPYQGQRGAARLDQQTGNSSPHIRGHPQIGITKAAFFLLESLAGPHAGRGLLHRPSTRPAAGRAHTAHKRRGQSEARCDQRQTQTGESGCLGSMRNSLLIAQHFIFIFKKKVKHTRSSFDLKPQAELSDLTLYNLQWAV